MEFSYDKGALQEYMDDMRGVGASMRRAQDESVTAYHSCQQQYTRRYTELEQAARKAYNRVEAAESMRRSADAKYDFSRNRLENAEDDRARENAQGQLCHAREQRAEAGAELASASAAYAQAQANMKSLADVWDRYQFRLEHAARKAEDGLSAFFTVVGSANRDLGVYMDMMDKARASLYDGSTAGQSASGSSGLAPRQSGGASAQSVEKISCINEDLAGKRHPETGVLYERKIVEADGRRIEGVFPQFESAFDAKLPEELYKESDYKQFACCTQKLRDAIQKDPALAKKFNARQLAQIMDGAPRISGYTWHHTEHPGEMQLVDASVHDATRHTGGRVVWGGGAENR